MKVVFYGSVLQHTNGHKEYSPDTCTDLGSLFELLGNEYDQNLKELLISGSSFLVIVNGRGASTTGGLETKLQHGDVVEILPFIEAG